VSEWGPLHSIDILAEFEVNRCFEGKRENVFKEKRERKRERVCDRERERERRRGERYELLQEVMREMCV